MRVIFFHITYILQSAKNISKDSNTLSQIVVRDGLSERRTRYMG